ncbi:MAG: type I-MYXAN CRISPR-associated Cas8a1/Cmx1 [Nostoc sp. ChiQUE01a]|nr:type I-MYXAN CRISPR-associated Cas8a1/Cmx1 [Nostoc sp. ChiQUE01a]
MSTSKNLLKPKIRLNLSDPNLTILHTAGFAGFSMTLRQLERLYPESVKRPSNLSWSLTPRAISLDWDGKEDLKVLDWLLKQSFQISDKGLIRLIGRNYQTVNIQSQIIIHLGITGTFLQHNKFFKSAGHTSETLIIDGMEAVVDYDKADEYAHQIFAKHLCNKQGQLLQEPIGIVGWLYPGAVMRHAVFSKETKFHEKPELALALLFAPVACHYFVLQSQLQHKKPDFALVIPQVTDLEVYAQHCWNLNDLDYNYFHASSLGDAGLKFFTYETSIGQALFNQVERCQVMLFRKAPWSKQQKTRTETAVLLINKQVNVFYKLSCKFLPNYNYFQNQNKIFFIANLLRGIIADNLINGLPWWFNLPKELNCNYFYKLSNNDKKGIYQMIYNSEWDTETKKLFIKCIHETLKIRYAKIYARTKEDEYAQIERENIRIISQLNRCTNAVNFRKFIAEFWGKAGHNQILQENLDEMLSITTGISDWRIAKDLTFIALASYAKSKTTEPNTSEV